MPSSLAPVKSRMVYLSGAGLPRLSWKKAVKWIPCFIKKTGPFVISSYLCFGSNELHENLQKYIGDVACCDCGYGIFDLLTILC